MQIKFFSISAAIFLVVFLLPVCKVFGYYIRHYTVDNGLPQSSVKMVKFDRDGYCWLSTEMGLVRFDGANFKVFGSKKFPQLRSLRMAQLGKDTAGNLFVVTSDDVEIMLQSKPSPFSMNPEVVPAANIHIVGNGYAIADSCSSDIFNRYGNKFSYPFANEISVLRSNEIYYAVFSAGRLNLYFRERQKELRSEVFTPSLKACFMPIQDSLLFLFNNTDDVRVYRHGKKIYQGTIDGPMASERSYRQGNCRFIWSEEAVYAVCDSNIYRISFDGGHIMSFLELEHMHIRALTCITYHRESGQYFIGSGIDGLYVIKKSVFLSPPLPPTLNDNCFYAQVKIGSGHIFARNLMFSAHGAPQPVAAHVSSVFTMFSFTGKDVLYQGDEYKLYRFDLATGQTTTMCRLPDQIVGIISVNEHEKLLFLEGRLIYKIRHMATKDSVFLFRKIELKDHTHIIGVEHIGGDFFLLQSGRGLLLYDIGENSVPGSILGNKKVISSVVDPQGRVWIATYGEDIYLLDAGRLYPVSGAFMPALNAVHSFIFRGRDVYMPANTGLYRASYDDLVAYAHHRLAKVYYYKFTVYDGLPGNEFNHFSPAPFVEIGNIISLANMEGLVWFVPEKLSVPDMSSNLFLDYMVVDGDSIKNMHDIVLPPGFAELNISLSAPYYGFKENEHMEYCLEGLNGKWEPVLSSGIIVYNKLPPGKYKIRVRKLIAAGGRYATLEISFSVTPWFYNTWWFYTAVIAGAVLIALLVFKKRYQIMKKRARTLQEIVESRTGELKGVIKQLELSETKLIESNEIKNNVITMVMHDIRSPVRFLETISSYIAEKPDDLNKEELCDRLKAMTTTIKNLNNFIDQFFSWATVQQKYFKVHNVTVSLDEMFHNIAEIYKGISNEHGNKLIISPVNLSCYTDYNILSVIIRNIVDNANKYTRNGEIRIYAISEGAFVSIFIADTGRGFSPGEIKLFLDTDADVDKKGTGSRIIMDMARRIEAEISIKSEAGHGTEFCIKLQSAPS